MWFRSTVPYNGGLDPAGTRRKFVSLKLECRQSAFKKSRTDQDASGMHFFGEQSKHSMVARVLPVGYLRVKPTAALSSVTLRKGMLPVHCLLSAQSLFAKAPTHPHPASAKGEVSLKLHKG